MVPQKLKNLPSMQETQVLCSGGEDICEKEMATHSNILAWRIPWTEELGGVQSMGSQRDGDDLGLNSSLMFIIGFCIYPVGIYYFPW